MNEDRVKNIVKTYRDLNVYQLSYSLAIKLFELAKKFPKEETYSLTDQVKRASRSIPANIAEGWTKRKYENVFIRHLIDSNVPVKRRRYGWISPRIAHISIRGNIRIYFNDITK